MRILSLSFKSDKLKQPKFIDFRFHRKDKDWQVGEPVQIVYRTRRKDREPLGVAVIVAKESVWMEEVTDQEAIADRFPGGKVEMWDWLLKAYGERAKYCRLNKLTLEWVKLP